MHCRVVSPVSGDLNLAEFYLQRVVPRDPVRFLGWSLLDTNGTHIDLESNLIIDGGLLFRLH